MYICRLWRITFEDKYQSIYVRPFVEEKSIFPGLKKILYKKKKKIMKDVIVNN